MSEKKKGVPSPKKTLPDLADDFESEGIAVMRLDGENPDEAVKVMHDFLKKFVGS